VAAGGVDDLGPAARFDGEVVQVGVVVNLDGADRLGLVLAGLGVGGQDLVAGLEGGDRGGLAAGQQDAGVAGEGLAAARGALVLVAAGQQGQQGGIRDQGGAVAGCRPQLPAVAGGAGSPPPPPAPPPAAGASWTPWPRTGASSCRTFWAESSVLAILALLPPPGVVP